MFDNLSEKLQHAFRSITGKGKLSDDNMAEALKQIRIALLEADVNFKVVKRFVNEVRAEALGSEVLKGLAPEQQLIKIVNDRLTTILGGDSASLNLKGTGPKILMMVGLQGSGKTTSCGKLARLLASGYGSRPYLVPCDVARPAAILQLQQVGEKAGIPVFDSHGIGKPLDIVMKATREAKSLNRDVLIIDTAGRLHIDDELMEELKNLKRFLDPAEILFVADAMTGQDAVTSARAFNIAMDITGVILTKMDGDARGGAALSIKSVTERPIKFIGNGEGVDDFEPFHPDRVASRILGMGDVLSLIEKVKRQIDDDEAKRMEIAMLKNQFTLDDFYKNISQIDRLGNMNSLMGMLPGMNKIKGKIDSTAESKQLRRLQAIIQSMTPGERHNHIILNNKRKKRIAQGSGTTVSAVNGLINQFLDLKKMVGMMHRPEKRGKVKQMFSKAGLGDFANLMGGPGMPTLPEGTDMEELRKLAAQNGGQLPQETIDELGLNNSKEPARPNLSRPKKDRKKEKAKRRQGRKRR